jgi:small GTP-binding protein
MPTNLPPEYFEAEEKFRQAESTAAKIECLEKLIGTIPKHKGTDKLRAGLRRKLSKLRAEKQKKKGAAKHESAFHIGREGEGRLVIIGSANVGKSSLLRSLTNATPKVSEYPFTTWTPTPGMMLLEDIQIQLIDTPPLNAEHIEPEFFDLVRSADLLLLVVDLQASPIQQLEESLAFLKEHKIAPQHLKEQHSEETRLTFMPLLVVVNKNDDEKFDEDFEIFCELLESDWPLIPISAAAKRNLEKLSRSIFEELGIIRIYSKPPGKEADLSQPFVVKKGSTVGEFAGKVHKDFSRKLKTARIWGTGVYDGQMVGRDHVLQDKDVVELQI